MRRSVRGSSQCEAELVFVTFCARPIFTFGLLSGRFKSAETAHFVHDALSFHFAFETLEGAVNGLTFFDVYFGHCKITCEFRGRTLRRGGAGKSGI